MTISSKGNKGGYTVARFTASGVVYPNNSGANGANTAGETVDGMTLVHAGWTVTGGNWTVARGGNTHLVLTPGQHSFDFSGDNLSLELGGDEQANTVVVLTAGSGTLILKYHKQSTIA